MCFRFLKFFVGVCTLAFATLAPYAQSQERDALRVCADPNSMPFSNNKQEGFENRIADLFSQSLGIPLEYTWFPQRRGFIRNTLRAKDPISGREKCDLVIAVPVQFEEGLVTQPYYRSTYVLVFKNDSSLGGMRSGDDLFALAPEVKDNLKIGVFDQTPATVWLAQHGMIRQMVGYPTLNADPDHYPGQLIERDLLNGELDAVIIWGPIGAYFAKKYPEANLNFIPLRSGDGIQFDFAIAMAVRFGDKDWRDQVKGLLVQHQDSINEILRSYHVPLLDKDGNPI